MKTAFISGLAAAGLICLGILAPKLAAAVPSPVGLSTGAEAVAPLATQVRKWNRGRYRGRNWRRYTGPRRAYVRRWYRRPYYGSVVAGVVLGTIIVASTVPRAPSSDLCWYWTNSSQTRGYWDYCD